MEFERFIKEIIEKLQEMAGSDYRFENRDINGLNGTVKHSLLAVGTGMDICPCINMDEYFKQYRSGWDLDVLAGHILEICGKDMVARMEPVSDFSRWDSVKHRIFARLINTEKNTELLRKYPNRPYLDLSLVYYVRVEGGEPEEYGSIQIRNEHMLHWEVDEKTLFQTSWENMRNAGEASFESLEEVLRSFFCPVRNVSAGRESAEMYVLGNKSRIHGAVQMCNPGALRGAAETIGDDFWILPSSIHEVILVPAHQAENGAQGLAEIVKGVNDAQVAPHEILSYHVYRYSRETEKLTIAA